MNCRVEMNAKLQPARRNMGIYEVLADDKDFLKMIGKARLKLESDKVIVVLCALEEPSCEKPPVCATLIQETRGSHLPKRTCDNFHFWAGS